MGEVGRERGRESSVFTATVQGRSNALIAMDLATCQTSLAWAGDRACASAEK
jgi:hypothetical protein